MRDTVWNGQVQSMQTTDGKQKGIKTILQERDCWIPALRLICSLCSEKTPPPNVNCCARRLLGSHQDFLNQQIWLEEVLNKRGHKLIFSRSFIANLIQLKWLGDLLRVNFEEHVHLVSTACRKNFH